MRSDLARHYDGWVTSAHTQWCESRNDGGDCNCGGRELLEEVLELGYWWLKMFDPLLVKKHDVIRFWIGRTRLL